MKSLSQLTEDIEKLERIILNLGEVINNLEKRHDDEVLRRVELQRLFLAHKVCELKEGAHTF